MDVRKRAFFTGALLYLALATAHAQSVYDPMFRDGFESPDSCPPGRQTTAMVGWRYDGYGRHNIVVTEVGHIYGRDVWNEQPVDMPWSQQFAVVWNMQRAGYLALRFTVPLDMYPLQTGGFRHNETIPGPPLDAAISRACGDFYPVNSFCSRSNSGTGHPLVTWKMPLFPGPALCPLIPGETYYLNQRIHDPAINHWDCGTNTCKVSTLHNHTP